MQQDTTLHLVHQIVQFAVQDITAQVHQDLLYLVQKVTYLQQAKLLAVYVVLEHILIQMVHHAFNVMLAINVQIQQLVLLLVLQEHMQTLQVVQLVLYVLQENNVQIHQLLQLIVFLDGVLKDLLNVLLVLTISSVLITQHHLLTALQENSLQKVLIHVHFVQQESNVFLQL